MGKVFHLALGLAALAAPAAAEAPFEAPTGVAAMRGELPPLWQCAPYARAISGIELYGDAYTWWDQARGRYARGHAPRVGAVMAFRPHGSMTLGHVAAVTRVIDPRTVLLDHANWSPIDGHRGQVERGVRAVDVSPANDWSAVRVWYEPVAGLGATAWPVEGFIYAVTAPRPAVRAASPAAAPALAVPAIRHDVIGEIIRAARR